MDHVGTAAPAVRRPRCIGPQLSDVLSTARARRIWRGAESADLTIESAGHRDDASYETIIAARRDDKDLTIP